MQEKLWKIKGNSRHSLPTFFGQYVKFSYACLNYTVGFKGTLNQVFYIKTHFFGKTSVFWKICIFIQ